MDTITLKRIETAHPKVREELRLIYKEVCAALTGRSICRFSHVFRSFAEQDALFAKRPKVTNARGGQSYHNYGLAVDIVLLVDKDGNGTHETASWETNVDMDGDGKADWMEVVSVFKRHGWEWGGDWKFTDYPHFQKTYSKSINELLSLHRSGKKDAEAYVII